jgi:regulator of sigma E protease
MDVLIMAGQLILGLSILVGLHELGHLLTAKMFGMRVEKFSIGFPPTIFKVQYGETEYAIGAIPLGGFVKISGMIDESMDKEFLNKAPEPWEFRAKPAWQRLIVMLGGIIVNVITGIVIFIVLTYTRGEEFIPASKAEYGIVVHEVGEKIGLRTGDKIVNINGKPFERFSDIKSSEVLLSSNAFYTVVREGKEVRIDIPNDLMDDLADRKKAFIDDLPVTKEYQILEIAAGSPAEKAGLKSQDLIVAVNDQPVAFYHELQQRLSTAAGEEARLKVKRGEEELELKATIGPDGKLGFVPAFVQSLFVHRDFGFGESVNKGTADAFGIVFDNIKGFGKIFRGEVSASKSLSGPIGIGKVYGSVWIWSKFWYITGMLSMILAFMNFLPIPALDGGHVMFISYEMISGRKLSDKFLENSQKVGMVLLLCLMVFAVFNDIFKAIF